MPTENRSSNTEMVSVPEGFMLVERSIWTEQQVEAATACITRLKGVPGMRDCDLAMAAIDAAQCKAPDIALSDLLPTLQPHPDPIAWMVGTAFWWTKEEAERDAAETGLPIVGLGPMTGATPADLQQVEPVALAIPNECPHIIVFDDADRPNEHFCGAGARTAALRRYEQISQSWNAHLFVRIARNSRDDRYPSAAVAEPAEVERLRIERGRMDQALVACANERDELRKANTEFDAQVANDFKFIDDLRAQLAEAQALLRDTKRYIERNDYPVFDLLKRIDAHLSASAEPRAPSDCAICRDLGSQCMECEEGEFRKWADRHFAAADYRKTDAGVFIQDWMRHSYSAWCARGTLGSKP